MKIIINIASFLIAYLIGSLSWSIIYSKKTVKGDIRNQGSGNAGATNIIRNYTMLKGVIIFLLDTLKIVIPGLIIWAISKWTTNEYTSSLIVQVACFGGFMGHIFPIYYKFKGGKGVASYYGFLIIYNFLFFIISYCGSYLIYKKFKYVSIGSITFPTIIFALSWIPWMNNGPLTYFMTPVSFWVNPICVLIFDVIIVYKHIPNIKRLINGTEKGIK